MSLDEVEHLVLVEVHVPWRGVSGGGPVLEMSNLPLVAAASGAMLVNQATAERIDAGAFNEGDPFDEVGDEPEQR